MVSVAMNFRLPTELSFEHWKIMPGAFLQNQAHTCWNDVGLSRRRKVTTFKKGASFGVTLPLKLTAKSP